MGLSRAGFRVVGFDIKPQPRYPFRFVQQDALTVDLSGFDAVWASPPCQAWSAMQRANVMRKNHPELVDVTRDKLNASGLPWIIENVPGAPLVEPIMLCGQSFGIRVLRHRLFESNKFLLMPAHVTHHQQEKVRGSTPNGYLDTLHHIGFTTGSNIAAFRDAMGCVWMTPAEARQAIPPAFSRYLGEQLIRYVRPGVGRQRGDSSLEHKSDNASSPDRKTDSRQNTDAPEDSESFLHSDQTECAATVVNSHQLSLLPNGQAERKGD